MVKVMLRMASQQVLRPLFPRLPVNILAAMFAVAVYREKHICMKANIGSINDEQSIFSYV